VNANGTLTFADSFTGGLQPGSYSITVTQSVDAAGAAPLSSKPQPFIVTAPQFAIDPSIVRTTQPASGVSTGADYCVLPHIVLDDHALPWERVPAGLPAGAPTTPWLALLVFADGEVTARASMTVSQLLAIGQGGTSYGPSIDPGSIAPQSVLGTQCRTISISGQTFNNVMPSLGDLPLMAHCETIADSVEPAGTVSVLLANRLPLDPSNVTPARYEAHLVSIDGFASLLGTQLAGDATVTLVTLYDWSFVSVPETLFNFETLAAGIAAHNAPFALSTNNSSQTELVKRFHDGYVPLTYVTISGEETFGWYRGPFAPVQPPALPNVGNPPVAVCAATNADELMIYSEQYGVFDLSYSAAWNFGRARALADAHFASNFMQAQQQVARMLASIAQRMAMPHLAGIDDARELLAPDVTRRRFASLIGDGLGRAWNAATKARGSNAPAGRTRPRAGIHPRDLVMRADVREAIAERAADTFEPIGAWLGSLVNLVPVPFSHLVPDPALLPAESIRFFFIDPNWIDALIAGATSIPLQGSGSLAATALIRDHFLAKAKYPVAGLLLRSQLVSGWPTLVINASLGGSRVTAVRDDTLSSSVRLLLFEQIPDCVSIGEPYHGVQLGMDFDAQNNLSITPRYVSGSNIGAPAGPSVPVNAPGGVLDLTALQSTLQSALNAPIGPGDFGLQMVRAPYELIFGNQQ